MTNRYEYGAWGEQIGIYETVDNRFRYTGREAVGDGRTVHYRARNYSPALGRFAAEDPLGWTDGINLYAYVSNCPAEYSDPVGTGPILGAIACGLAVGIFVADVRDARDAAEQATESNRDPNASADDKRKAARAVQRATERLMLSAAATITACALAAVAPTP